MVMNFINIIEKPTISFFLIIIFLFFTIQLVTSYNTPIADKFSMNCGFSGNSQTTSYGRTWEPDDESKVISLSQNSHTSKSCKASQVSPLLDQVPYATARLSLSEFTYSFNVNDGQKIVRLFFYPATYSNFDRSNALFTVKAGHHTLLKDFNASLTADNEDDHEEKVFKEYCVNVEPGHMLNITFTPSTNHPDAYAFINGIEVVALPTGLYYPEKLKLKLVDEKSGIRVDNSSALEMAYRINVGGGEIVANQDTGLLRDWQDITGYGYKVMGDLQDLKDGSGTDLIYQTELPKKAAPADVYLSAKTSSDGMTWEFEVDSMFAYMIRLHFCELEQSVQKGQRLFQIFIEDFLDEAQLDVVGWLGDSRIPDYKDYAVLLKQRSLKRQKLSIKLQKHPKSKYGVLLNGIEIFKISDQSDNLGGPNPDPRSSSSTKTSSTTSKKNTKATMLIAFVCAALVVIVLSVIGFFIFKRMKSRSTRNKTDSCHKFSIGEIKAATNNFDKLSIIGHGGFGEVYRGQIKKGKSSTLVAIKRLKAESQQGVHEFLTEIDMLSKFRHTNLVDLIGYCNDDKEMILVYEYMPRGALSDYLNEPANKSLTWKQRLEICIGAARALSYLHAQNGENKQSVIHRDVKSSNILLGHDWVAKVSDFGLSKIGPNGLSKSHVTTVVKGSIGYIDPEYFQTQQLTSRSDVYSFGVVLLEILCGKPHIFRNAEKERGSLVDWVKKCYEKGDVDVVVDPFLMGRIPHQCLNKFVHVALACLRDNGKHRPSMGEVVSDLENLLKMQGSMEVEILRDGGKAKCECKTGRTQFTRVDEESGIQFSISSGSTTTDSKCTVTSSEEELALVPAVFSEIAHPTAR